MSTTTISWANSGKLGGHLPLLAGQGPRSRGRKRGLGYEQSTAGKLQLLRDAAKAITTNREQMDGGWFVPTEAMEKLVKALG